MARSFLKDGLCYSTKQNEVKIHTFVSMMPDQSDLYNHLSGREHLKMFATMWKSDLKLIDETIEALNMGHYVNKRQVPILLGCANVYALPCKLLQIQTL